MLSVLGSGILSFLAIHNIVIHPNWLTSKKMYFGIGAIIVPLVGTMIFSAVLNDFIPSKIIAGWIVGLITVFLFYMFIFSLLSGIFWLKLIPLGLITTGMLGIFLSGLITTVSGDIYNEKEPFTLIGTTMALIITVIFISLYYRKRNQALRDITTPEKHANFWAGESVYELIRRWWGFDKFITSKIITPSGIPQTRFKFLDKKWWIITIIALLGFLYPTFSSLIRSVFLK